MSYYKPFDIYRRRDDPTCYYGEVCTADLDLDPEDHSLCRFHERNREAARDVLDPVGDGQDDRGEK